MPAWLLQLLPSLISWLAVPKGTAAAGRFLSSQGGKALPAVGQFLQGTTGQFISSLAADAAIRAAAEAYQRPEGPVTNAENLAMLPQVQEEELLRRSQRSLEEVL